MEEKYKVIIAGALGKMGLATVKAVWEDNELELVGLVDVKGKGENIRDFTGIKDIDIPVSNDLDQVINTTSPHVMIDFTNPQAVFNNARTALKKRITCVIGTTGLTDIEIRQLDKLAQDNGVGIAIIPNFAIGAVLMMKFAAEAAKYFPDVEIIEMHHDQKIDAPSGTALKTAEMINENRPRKTPRLVHELEKVAGSRGGDVDSIRVHSVRLPGFVAHQEVIFGGVGQSLKIRHDSLDRTGFMPGVIMTVKKMIAVQGLVYGMENLM